MVQGGATLKSSLVKGHPGMHATISRGATANYGEWKEQASMGKSCCLLT